MAEKAEMAETAEMGRSRVICEADCTPHAEKNPIGLGDNLSRAATGIGNTDFLSVTDFFAQKGGKPNIFRYFSWGFYR